MFGYIYIYIYIILFLDIGIYRTSNSYITFTYYMLWQTASPIFTPHKCLNCNTFLQSTILGLKWPMCADVPLRNIKIKSTWCFECSPWYLAVTTRCNHSPDCTWYQFIWVTTNFDIFSRLTAGNCGKSHNSRQLRKWTTWNILKKTGSSSRVAKSIMKTYFMLHYQ